MSQDQKDLFFRQRRNLMITSLLFLFTFILDSELKLKKLNVFGNEFTLGNPVKIENLLLIILVYFLLRYYQYFLTLEDREIKTAFRGKSEFLAKKKAMKIFKVKHVNDRLAPTGNHGIKNRYPWVVEVQYKDEEQVGAQGGLIEPITLGKRDAFIICLKSVLHVVFNTTKATEYLLPFIIAFIPLLIYFWQAASAYVR